MEIVAHKPKILTTVKIDRVLQVVSLVRELVPGLTDFTKFCACNMALEMDDVAKAYAKEHPEAVDDMLLSAMQRITEPDINRIVQQFLLTKVEQMDLNALYVVSNAVMKGWEMIPFSHQTKVLKVRQFLIEVESDINQLMNQLQNEIPELEYKPSTTTQLVEAKVVTVQSAAPKNRKGPKKVVRTKKPTARHVMPANRTKH